MQSPSYRDRLMASLLRKQLEDRVAWAMRRLLQL
jgi:hypothetical protein